MPTLCMALATRAYFDRRTKHVVNVTIVGLSFKHCYLCVCDYNCYNSACARCAAALGAQRRGAPGAPVTLIG